MTKTKMINTNKAEILLNIFLDSIVCDVRDFEYDPKEYGIELKVIHNGTGQASEWRSVTLPYITFKE